MAGFIEQCRHAGKRVNIPRARGHVLRPRLMGRLLQDRTAARFLVAPEGYGKSYAAYEYAKVMFDMDGVFWVDCTSPCFIRDLDRGSIVEDMSATDPDASLAVFEDVPALDDGRLEAFSDVLTQLSSIGCEVLVTCLPSCAGVASASRYATVLGSEEMLLADDEIELAAARGSSSFERLSKRLPSIRPRERIAALAWEDDADRIASAMRDEALPASMRCIAYAMLVLGSGDIEAIAELMDVPTIEEDLAWLAPRYPHLGIDIEGGAFDPMEVRCACLKGKHAFDLEELSSAAGYGSGTDMALALAEAARSSGGDARGCEFAVAFMRKAQASAWIASNGWDMAMGSQPAVMVGASMEVRGRSGAMRSVLDSQCAWAAMLLGDRELSRTLARRAVRCKDRQWSTRAAAMSLSFLGVAISEGVDAAEDVRRCLDMMPSDDPACSASMGSAPISWDVLCELGSLMQASDEMPFSVLAERLRDPSPDIVSSACLCAPSVIARSYESIRKRDLPGEDGIVEAVSALTSIVNRCALSPAGSMAIPPGIWLECSRTLSRLDREAPALGSEPLSREAVLRMGSLEAEWDIQAAMLHRTMAEKEERDVVELSTLPDSPRHDISLGSKGDAVKVRVPKLHVRLFGGFAAWIDGDPDPSRIIPRSKSKAALAILAVNKGREVSKERITESLWPDSDFECRQRNFYVVWSELKRVLSIGSGCPYLVRSQTGYRIDTRYLESDLDEFEALCHDLMLDDDRIRSWRESYDLASGYFAEDLLPEFRDPSIIQAARTRCREQMADALVAASSRLLSEGENMGAIWFARDALRRDRTREDAYIALMRAQISADQRAAALESYFECRRSLGEGLGIDPSLKVMELYRSIIETEETL